MTTIMLSLIASREGGVLLHAVIARRGAEDEDVHAIPMGEIITIMIGT